MTEFGCVHSKEYGSKTDPWGTPNCKYCIVDSRPLHIITCWLLPVTNKDAVRRQRSGHRRRRVTWPFLSNDVGDKQTGDAVIAHWSPDTGEAAWQLHARQCWSWRRGVLASHRRPGSKTDAHLNCLSLKIGKKILEVVETRLSNVSYRPTDTKVISRPINQSINQTWPINQLIAYNLRKINSPGVSGDATTPVSIRSKRVRSASIFSSFEQCITAYTTISVLSVTC